MKEKIYIKDFLNLLLTHKKPLLIIMGVSVLSMVQLSFVLPKTYRTDFELNIYSKYFKNALISEVIPGMNSIQEMTQTVESMVKEVMSDEFIDHIGNTYNIYPKNLPPYELSKRRQFLRDQFILFSTGGQSYRIGFMHSDPNVTYEVSKKVMDTVRSYFIDSRIETIEIAKRTILKKLESVNVTKHITDSDISSNALASKNPTVLRSEIAKINLDINALKLQFNIQHPRIVKLEQRKATLENWVNEPKNNETGVTPDQDSKTMKEYNDAPLMMAGNAEIQNTIAAKLYSKFNDINIALDIERKSLPSYIGIIESPQYPTSPLFPKKRLFASLGFMIGLIACFGYVFYKEVMSLDSIDATKDLALLLKSEYLGILPHIDETQLMSNKLIFIKETDETKNLDDSPGRLQTI
jgi:capsular polysaccharide biosynthesis protein